MTESLLLPSLWRRLGSAVLDLLYPPRCVSCSGDDSWLCDSCVRAFDRISPPFCQSCGHPSAAPVCSVCVEHPLALERIRAFGMFEGGLRKAILALKYENLTVVAPLLGALMADTWSLYGREVDLIVPVPLRPAKARRRGYNQAAILARVVGRYLEVPVAARLLRQVRGTRDQIGLSGSERRNNVRGAFAIASTANWSSGKEGHVQLSDARVLLVDDVCTTGSTLDGCATPLLAAGARSVAALVAAR